MRVKHACFVFVENLYDTFRSSNSKVIDIIHCRDNEILDVPHSREIVDVRVEFYHLPVSLNGSL